MISDKWDMIENLAVYLCFEHSDWRYGQAIFNALYILNPDTANLIRGTEYDCFYSNNKIETFKKKVLEIWR